MVSCPAGGNAGGELVPRCVNYRMSNPISLPVISLPVSSPSRQAGVQGQVPRAVALDARFREHDEDSSIKYANSCNEVGCSRRQPTFTLPRRKPGSNLPAARAAAIWVPAFPTDKVRGLKAHGTAARSRFHALRVGNPGGDSEPRRRSDAASERARLVIGRSMTRVMENSRKRAGGTWRRAPRLSL
jgi:hypothetical protein